MRSVRLEGSEANLEAAVQCEDTGACEKGESALDIER